MKIFFALLPVLLFSACPGDPDSGVSATCGNGSTEAGEDCDDGNVDDGDGCSAGCTAEFAGEVCREAGCFGIGACPADDRFEPNDHSDYASFLQPGMTEGLAMCHRSGGELSGLDVYQVRVCDQGALQVDLLFDHADVNLDLRLGFEQLFVARSTSETDDESAEFVNESGAETVIDIVASTEHSDEGGYALRVTLDQCP